jgi:hypothetical protein
MGAESETFSQLEIAHVLFTDIVSYSKKAIDQQSELLGQLNQVVRGTEQFRAAEAAAKLVRGNSARPDWASQTYFLGGQVWLTTKERRKTLRR